MKYDLRNPKDKLSVSFKALSELSKQLNQNDVTVNDILDIRLEFRKHQSLFPDLCEKLIRCADLKLNRLTNGTPLPNTRDNKPTTGQSVNRIL